MVDIGCGEKPYAPLFAPYVKRHIGVDHADSYHCDEEVDVCANAYDTTLPDDFADTVLSTAVLEHLERPRDAMREIQRILRPGGHLILTAPLFWHLHEEPRDFFRYTSHGLKYLLEEAGLQPVEIKPLSGFIVTFCQAWCYFLRSSFLNRRLFRLPTRFLVFCIQAFGYLTRRWDKSNTFTWMYLVIARKPGESF